MNNQANVVFLTGHANPLNPSTCNRRYWPIEVSGEQIDDFDSRIELRILASQLRLRVQIEINVNRAQRDIQIETHYAMRDLFKSIKYGVHHAEI